MSGRRLLVALGDAESMATWSGTPFHLLAAGRKTGFLQGGLRLVPHTIGLRSRRSIWNAAALLTSGRPGGFQYSPAFLKRVCSPKLMANEEGAEFLSHFPLLPPCGRGHRVSFYIDATLKQNFEDYGLGERIARRLQLDAMAREREQYQRAERVVCMSSWAAESVVSDYAVPRSNVFVVRAGANLDEEALLRIPPAPEPGRDVLRLGFVGKDWERKGLPYLLSVAEEIDRRGQRVEVVAIGPSQRDTPTHRLLRVVGFVDKARELPRFVAIVQGMHFGCLFSRAEALGISTLEFLRLGVPVAGFDVGGIRGCITPDVGLLLAPGTAPSAAADGFLAAWERAGYGALRTAARARATEVTWTATVAALEKLWETRG